jgi:hypothetical protein
MNENDLKRYTVILGGGSGVLFQPLDETKTYILSAKHVFYKKEPNDRGTDINVLLSSIDYCFSDKQSVPITFEIKEGENYFEHSDENVDAAILILNENLGFNQIFVDQRMTSFNEFNLTGYPNSKRKTDDKYDKLIISDLNSYDDSLIALRLVVNHLDHEQITGFSGGGIMKTNGDSLLLAGIQSKTPIGPCNGEIQIVPIKRFEEIIQQNNLPQLLPNFFSKIDLLLGSIIEFNHTTPNLRPKLQGALRRQAKQIKCDLKDIYNRKILNKSAIKTNSLSSKQFWVSFLEYAIIISLIEDLEFNEELLNSMSKKRKFIFSDSSKSIYDLYSDILMFAAENIDDQCQVLVGTSIPPTTTKTRRMSTAKVPQNIYNVDDDETIDRIALRSKIKEIIHIKAIELDCINENDAVLDLFSIDQFDEILTEIKKIVNEFFNN